MKKLYILLLAAFAFYGANAQTCADTVGTYLFRTTGVSNYTSTAGYVSGTNSFTLEVGNNFDDVTGGTLTDALIWFGVKKIIGSTDSITIYVYNTSPVDSLPTGAAIASKKISVASLDTNFNTNPINFTKVHFNTPIPITGRYAISVQVAGAGLNDTVAVFTNAQNDGAGERRAFIKNTSNTFGHLASYWNATANTPIDVDLMIFPILNACPVVNITGTTAICTGSTTTLTAHTTRGYSPFTYNWSNGSTDSTLVASTAGSYTVTVTDYAGYTTTATVTTTIANCGGVCTANAAYTTPGLWPVSDSIPCVVDGQAYSYTLTLRNFTTYQGAPIDSVHIDSITNLPCGIVWTPNKASRTYNSGELGCILLSGTSNEIVGQYKMNVYVKAYSSFFPTPVTTTLENLGFRKDIRVKATSGAVCTATNTSSNGATAQTTCASVPLSVSISGNTQICAGGSTTLTAVGAGGSGTYTYAWSGSTTGATKTVNAAGTYTVTVTSGSATATASATVTSIAAATISISSSPNPPCAGQTNTFTATVANAGTGTVTWFLNNNQIANGTTYAPTNLVAGNTVYAQVAPSNGCPTATSSTLTVTTCATPVTVSISGNTQICSGGSTVLTAIGSGGTGTYTYTWSGNTTGATKTVTAAGTYTVTVTSGAATATASVTTTVITCGVVCTPNPAYTQPGIYPSSDSIPCIVQNQAYNTTVYIKNFDQVFYMNQAFTLDSITIDSITNLPCGITWVSNKAPRNNYNKSESGCIQVSGITTDAVGQYKLGIWVTAYPSGFGGFGLSQELGAVGIRKDLRVIATSASNCTLVDTFATSAIAQRTCSTTQPVQVTIGGNTQICTGSNTTLTASATGGNGTYTYAWTGNTTGATKTVIAAGTYTVTVTSGSSTATASVTITVATPATISIASNPATPCANQSNTFTASVTGGGSGVITWFVNGGNVSAGNIYTTATLAAGDVVTAQIAPSSGCPTVTSNSLTATTCTGVSANITGTSLICAGSSDTLTVQASGGTTPYTYRWSNNTTTVSTVVSSGGIYTVTVTDANSSTATATFTVTVAPTASITITSVPNPPCANQSNTFTANVSNGGNAPVVNWLVNGNQTAIGTTFTSATLQTGNVVTARVVPSNGCASATSNQIFVSSCNGLLNVFTTGPDTICAGGRVTLGLQVSGGTGTYTYTWSPATGLSATNIAHPFASPTVTTTYTVVVSDGTLSGTDSTKVVIKAGPSVTLANNDITICTGSTATLQATAGNASGSETYSWSPSSTLSCASCATTTASPINTTVYTVTVTDGGVGCEANASVAVHVTNAAIPLVALVALRSQGIAGCDGSNIFVTTTTAGGTNPAYAWTLNGNALAATSDSIHLDSLAAGDVVEVQLTSSLGCASPDTTSASLIIGSCTGIEQLVLDQHVKLYPNPNDGHFVLTIDQNAGAMDIQILNIQGRVIYTEHVKDYASGNRDFNLGDLAKGVYLLKVSTEQGNAVKRLVIQ